MPSHNHAATVITIASNATPEGGSIGNCQGFTRWNSVGNGGTLDKYGVATLVVNSTGSSLSHSVMPSYQDVYAWRRIA